MTPADLARICHEANRAYANSLGEQPWPWSVIDAGEQAMWVAAVEYQSQRGITPEQAHTHWLSLEAAAGWSYGPTLDNAARQHPCHVPWAYLPEPHRRKIRISLAIVRVFFP